MTLSLGHVAVLVREYDEAREWFTHALGFELLANDDLGGGKRWVVVGPPGTRGATLLLARAATPEQVRRIGNQTGGRVWLFLHTDDFGRDHTAFLARGVRFVEGPRDERYGTVAVFEDLYGNRWDLIEPRGL